jgi:putative addiction module component (TIGR02574 family)
MSRTLQEEISQLSASEKLLLVEDLWDQIAKESDIQLFPLPDSQRLELDRRYQDFLQNPSEGSSWADVKRRILGQ